jgi:hypothetical protein
VYSPGGSTSATREVTLLCIDGMTFSNPLEQSVLLSLIMFDLYTVIVFFLIVFGDITLIQHVVCCIVSL